jgi:hypothetical protein
MKISNLKTCIFILVIHSPNIFAETDHETKDFKKCMNSVDLGFLKKFSVGGVLYNNYIFCE